MIPQGIFNQTTKKVTSIFLSHSGTIDINQGSTYQLIVTATWSDGSFSDVTNLASYHSSFTERVTVNSTGLATASSINTGTATIIVDYGGATAWLNINVVAYVMSLYVVPGNVSLAVGNTHQIITFANWSDGSQTNVTSSASYTRTNTRINVTSGGLVTALSVGSSGVNISYGGHSATVSFAVLEPVTLTSISVSPTSFTIPRLGTQQLTVTGHYSDSSTQNITNLATYSQGSRFTTNSSGLVTGSNSGTAGNETITISYGGKSTSTTGTLTVPVTLTSISVSPTSTSLLEGNTQQLTITAPAPTLVSFEVSPNGGTIVDLDIINITVIGTYSDSSTKILTPSEITWTLDIFTHMDIVAIVPRTSAVGNSWWYTHLEGPPYPTEGSTTYRVSYTGSEGSPSDKFVTFTIAM